MNFDNVKLAQQKVDRHSNFAFFHQGLWIIPVIALLLYDPPYAKLVVECLSVCALLATWIASRLYIAAGKELEKYKTLSQEEKELAKREYSFKFFSFYVFWVQCIVWFSLK